MRIGIIYTAFNTAEYIPMSLGPWIKARSKRDEMGKTIPELQGHQFLIAAVSVPFKGFEVGALDDTVPQLQRALGLDQIDHLITSDAPMTEVDARGEALRYLVGRGVDVIWQFDADEEITIAQIEAIIAYTERNPFVQWFRLSYKNLVFSATQYLAEPFTPPRIHRVHGADLMVAYGFWDDNNVYYMNTTKATRDIELSSMTVPTKVAWIKHWTWLNDERSRKKIDYQVNARKWPSCSFAWDEKKGLVFNKAHFAALGQPLPKVIRET